jgi:hypothetical protein
MAARGQVAGMWVVNQPALVTECEHAAKRKR